MEYVELGERYFPIGREKELLDNVVCPNCEHSVSAHFTSLGRGVNDSGYKILKCKQCGTTSEIDTNLSLLAVLWKKKKQTTIKE